jgi:hypothetical protein
MIRIDEIYYNTLLPVLQEKSLHGLHWFDPFGSVQFNDLCSVPPIPNIHDAVRYLFWDQEPLHKELVDQTLTQFKKVFNVGKHHIVTSEYNSKMVEYVRDTYGFQPHYYFFHGWAALDWYRGYNRTSLCQPFTDRQFTKTFLCPNNIIGGRRRHRLALLNELVDRDLIENNFVSFPDQCPYENKTVAELCVEYDIPLGHVNLPLVIDQGANHAGNSHRIDMWELAKKSLLHVVTETVYDGRRQHLTEKTFKPIVMQQPFVLVSCQGSLEYLRRYGFKTFGTVFNEDYDNKDDNARILCIGKLLTDINNLSQKEKQQMQRHLTPIVEHNFKWFYSQEFEQLLWQELQDMLNEF